MGGGGGVDTDIKVKPASYPSPLGFSLEGSLESFKRVKDHRPLSEWRPFNYGRQEEPAILISRPRLFKRWIALSTG